MIGLRLLVENKDGNDMQFIKELLKPSYFKKILYALLLFTAFAVFTVSFAQTRIDFWYAQPRAGELLEEIVAEFNDSQNDYEIVATFAGAYEDSSTKLIAALGTTNQPILFDAEVTVFGYLANEGALIDLNPHLNVVSPEVITDVYPQLWSYGDLNGARYGLPYSMSVPILVYNATAFEQRGVDAPINWDEFEEVAGQMTTRKTRGFINVTASFIFETLVNARGGQIVTADGSPDFANPISIEALEMLKRMTKSRHSTNRNFGEVEVALIDFVRTKGMMGFSSSSFFDRREDFDVPFQLGIGAIPLSEGGHVPLMESQLVVLNGANEAQQKGALAFWEYMMTPEVNERWVKETYYLPTRRATTTLLNSWLNEDEDRQIMVNQIEISQPRPRIGNYAIWQSYLEEGLEKSLRGNWDATKALEEAQQRAENAQ